MELEFSFATVRPEKQDYIFEMSRYFGKFSAGTTQKVVFHLLPNRIFRKLFVNCEQSFFSCKSKRKTNMHIENCFVNQHGFLAVAKQELKGSLCSFDYWLFIMIVVYHTTEHLNGFLSLKGLWYLLNSKNNAPVLLFKTILRHSNGFLPSVATDGKDGHGLKL